MTQPQPPQPPRPPQQPRPSSGQPPRPPIPPRPRPEARQEDHPIGGALFGGAVAALVAAGIWALVTKATNTEYGMLAWGVGLLVGVVMSKMTPARSATLGVYAALLAMLGLATGKVLTLKIMSASAHELVIEDPEGLAQAFLMDMRDRESFSPEVNQQILALGDDTLPDALFATMQSEAMARMEAAPAPERERVAKHAVTMVMGNLTLTDQFIATLSLFDLLWFFLAIGTAWKMMKE
jgi:hypothetical protein